MNKVTKALVIATAAVATVSFAKQKYLSFAPITGYVIGDPEMVNFTIQGQVAKEMFERLIPSVAHDKADRVCAKGETKANKFVLCDVDKNKNYECKFTVMLNDKIDYPYLEAPYECDADPALKNHKAAQEEAKKNGYWRYEE